MPEEEAGRFISHLPPSFGLLLGHSDGQIQPEAKGQESLSIAIPIRHTQKRKRYIWRGKKKRELFSTVTMKIAQIYPDLRQTIWKIVLGFFPPWTTTYTNRFLDEILITSTSSIFAETEKASFPAQILSIRLSLATRNRKPD